MRITTYILGTCAFAAMAGALAAPALAQDATGAAATPVSSQSDDTSYEGDIIVSARRRDETAQNTPVPLTVLNEVLLDRYGVKGIASIAQLTPGLMTGEASGAIGGSISLRGIGSGESQPFIDQVVSVNVDGVQISSAQILRAAQLDLKQVEVLRGPQALFFGKNSPGGVISLTSADPGTRTEFLARAGYEFKANERYAEATYSTPLSDTVGLRVAGRYSKMDGYVNVESPNLPAGIDPYGLKAFPKQKEVFLRGTLAWTPSDRVRVRLKGTLTDTDIVGGASYFTDVVHCPYGTPQETPVVADNCKNDGTIITSLLPAAYPAINPLNVNDRHGGRHNKQHLLTGIIEYDATDSLKLTSVTGYYAVRERMSSNGSYSVTPNYGFAVGFKLDQFSQELRLASDFEAPVNFVVGGFFEDRKLWTATHLGVPSAMLNLYTVESTHQKQTSYSGFGQLMFDVSDKIQVTAGGRYTREIKDLLDYTVSSPTLAPVDVTKLPTYPGGPTPSLTFNNFSPEATVTFKPIDDLMVFASYKRGYKSGGFDAGYTAGAILSPARQAQGQRFRPEKVEGGEIGLKSTLFDRQFTLNLTGYWYDYSDLQVAVFDTQIHAFRTENAAQARIKGLELETSFRPNAVPGLNLHAAVAYNDAKFREYVGDCYAGQTRELGCNLVPNTNVLITDPATGTQVPRYTSQDLSGKRLRKAPAWAATFGAYYETPVASGLLTSLSLDGSYSSGYISSTNYNPDTWQRSFVKLDATWRLFTDNKRWELAVIGRNLTDKRNLINANDRNGTGGGKGGFTQCSTLAQTGCDRMPDITGTPTVPRTVAVQVTFRY